MTDRIEEADVSRDEGEESKESVEEERVESASLEEATLESTAEVERRGDYDQSEAIESALAELVDTAQEAQAIPDKDAEGSETYDPRKEYSSVEMEQGEVIHDDDWNDEADGAVQMDFDAKPMPAVHEPVRSEVDLELASPVDELALDGKGAEVVDLELINQEDELALDGKGSDVIDRKRPGRQVDAHDEVSHIDHWSNETEEEGDVLDLKLQDEERDTVL